MRKPRISLYIEELVLQGFGAGSGDRIKSAVERELIRLIEEHGLPGRLRAGHDYSHPLGGGFTIVESMGIDAVGSGVAHSIFESFGGGPEKGV